MARNPGIPLALLTLGLHLWASGNYGYFRDELYFIVCGRNPSWGYVDQPPLVPLIAGAMDYLFAPSLVMLRLVPGLAHALTVLLAAMTAELLGGRAWARALAALTVMSAGVFLATGTILSTDSLQPLAWLFISYALIHIIRGGDQRWWFAIGVTAGLALLSKYMLVFWLGALFVGVLATSARRVLASTTPFVAAAVTLAIVLPNVIWQATRGFPFLEIARVAATSKNIAFPPIEFMGEQILNLGPANALVWIAGLAAFANWRRFSDLRLFAIAYVLLIAVMLVEHGKPYYPAGAYPVLFAGGAVALEAWVGSLVLRTAIAAVVVAVGVVAAPFALPILPIDSFVAYQNRLGLKPKSLERGPIGELPQLYADMFGWHKLAALVGHAYQSLSPEDQARAVFFANNYGEASAIDVLGAPWHLPPAISAHNNFFIWGPRGHDGSVVFRLGGDRQRLLEVYDTCEPAGVFNDPRAMPYETGRTLWLCRNRKRPLEADWAELKTYR